MTFMAYLSVLPIVPLKFSLQSKCCSASTRISWYIKESKYHSPCYLTLCAIWPIKPLLCMMEYCRQGSFVMDNPRTFSSLTWQPESLDGYKSWLSASQNKSSSRTLLYFPASYRHWRKGKFNIMNSNLATLATNYQTISWGKVYGVHIDCKISSNVLLVDKIH